MKEYRVKIRIPSHVFVIKSADGKQEWTQKVGELVPVGKKVLLDEHHATVKHWLETGAIAEVKSSKSFKKAVAK